MPAGWKNGDLGHLLGNLQNTALQCDTVNPQRANLVFEYIYRNQVR